MSAQAEECPDHAAIIDTATQLVLTLRIDEATKVLKQAEQAMACGSAIQPEVLARFWIVEGATQSMGGDAEAARDAFAAAILADSEVWIDALGPQMRTVYDEAASDLTPVGLLDWTPTDAWAAVDGVPVQSPATIAGGLRLVQIGASTDDIQFAQIIMVSVGTRQTLNSGVVIQPKIELDSEPAAVEAVAEVPKEMTTSPIGIYASVGTGMAFGAPFDFDDRSGETFEEPALKLVLPAQVGLCIRVDTGWVRGVIHGAPLLTGTYLFANVDGIGTSSLAYGGSLAGGPTLGPVDLGLSAGLQIPSRLTGRGIVAVGLGDLPLSVELNGGVNYVAGRGIEPAASLGMAFATNRRKTP